MSEKGKSLFGMTVKINDFDLADSLKGFLGPHFENCRSGTFERLTYKFY